MITLSSTWRRREDDPDRYVGALKQGSEVVWTCGHSHHYTRTLAKSCAMDSSWLVARTLENQLAREEARR